MPDSSAKQRIIPGFKFIYYKPNIIFFQLLEFAYQPMNMTTQVKSHFRNENTQGTLEEKKATNSDVSRVSISQKSVKTMQQPVPNPNLSKGIKYYLPIRMYHIHHTHTIMKRWQSLLAMNSEVRSHTAGNQTYFRKVMQMKEIEIANLVTAEFGSNTFIKG